jgi:dynein heavy chain
LKDIQFFSEFKKDSITEETIELLEPYLTLKMPDDAAKFAGIDLFTKEVAEVSNKSLGGLCDWAAAMSDYHKASKIVKPKLKLLEVKGAELAEAQEKLGEAEAELAEVTALKERLKKTYDDAMAKKNFLEENAAKTRKKMTDANKLISSLADNKTRWTQ